MNRYLARLVVIAALIVGTGAVVKGLGYSGHAAVLGMLLVAALSFAPTMLALEGIARVRHPGTLPPAGGQYEPPTAVQPQVRPRSSDDA